MIAGYIQKVRKFLQHDLWVVKINTLTSWKAIVYRVIRVWTIAISEFSKDKCGDKASALTYFSLLSVVPVLAMAFGIATIFGLEKFLKRELTNYFAGQQEVLNFALDFADNMLSTSSGGIISGISAVFLIYAVVRLLSNIEAAFNDVWDTQRGRTLKRKITDYMSVILLGPIILILSSSATAYIATSIENLTESIELLGFFKPVILFLIKLIPYTLIWFLLFLMYVVFPNTSVKIRPALIAGVLAGTAYQLTQFAWIEGQVYLSRYSVIYGSLAILPLFMIWLQLSWTIILFGAEFSFALQNVRNWSYDSQDLEITKKAKRRLTLLIMKTIIREFAEKDEPLSFDSLCKQITLPRRFVKEIVRDLELAKLILRVDTVEDEELYVPGLDINKIDVFTVFDALENRGLNNLPQQEKNEGYQEISEVITNLDKSIKESPANRLLKDL